MNKTPLLFAVALLLPASPALSASKPEAVLAKAAQLCTTHGAFGRDFSDTGYGHVDAIADDEWAPFRRLVIDSGRITAEASFHDAGNSREDDITLAQRFFKVLDKAVKTEDRFPHRDANGNGVTFHTSKEPDSGLVFDIRRDGDRVMAACVALGD